MSDIPAPRSASFYAMLVLMGIVLFVCVRIEVLNRNAGNILPRTEYRNGDPQQGLTKWRVSALNEAQTIESMGLREPLTSEQRAIVDARIAKNRANSALRDVVGTAGILQYPLVAVLFLVAFVRLLDGRKLGNGVVIEVLALLVVGLCGALMFHRGYFESLGW